MANETIFVLFQKLGAYSSMLSISDASPRHDGNYTCHANNAASSASYTAPLHVDGGCGAVVVTLTIMVDLF
jgi:hypothetical protein